ncbi:MAG TPA: AraC family transcriptional regulator [Bradyrhizobium sp.]|nr:AraC family transcriptional regulator [Bradyrhizobium sp.]
MTRRDTGNRTSYWQSRHIPGMSLLRADFSHHDYGPHTHDAFVIAVTEAGGAEIRSQNIAQKVGPSTLFVSNPEERQSARMGDSGRWRYRSFYLTRLAIDDLARRFGIDAVPYFTRNMLDDGDLIERFGRLHQVLETEPDDALLADELAIDAFGKLFARYGSGGVRPEHAPRSSLVVRQLMGLMQERYYEKLVLDDLARFANLTSFQLIKLFKRSVGLTPHAYLVHVRLNAACRHLKRGHSLAESALAAGFCDQSALNRHFKRCYGITPLQFADAVRAG